MGPPYHRRCSRTAFSGGNCSHYKRDCRPPRLLVSQGGAAWAGTEATGSRVGRAENSGPIRFKRGGHTGNRWCDAGGNASRGQAQSSFGRPLHACPACSSDCTVRRVGLSSTFCASSGPVTACRVRDCPHGPVLKSRRTAGMPRCLATRRTHFLPRRLDGLRGLAIKALVSSCVWQVLVSCGSAGTPRRRSATSGRGGVRVIVQPSLPVPRQPPRHLCHPVPHAPSPPPLRARDRSPRWGGGGGGAFSSRWWMLVVVVTLGPRWGRRCGPFLLLPPLPLPGGSCRPSPPPLAPLVHLPAAATQTGGRRLFFCGCSFLSAVTRGGCAEGGRRPWRGPDAVWRWRVLEPRQGATGCSGTGRGAVQHDLAGTDSRRARQQEGGGRGRAGARTDGSLPGLVPPDQVPLPVGPRKRPPLLFSFFPLLWWGGGCCCVRYLALPRPPPAIPPAATVTGNLGGGQPTAGGRGRGHETGQEIVLRRPPPLLRPGERTRRGGTASAAARPSQMGAPPAGCQVWLPPSPFPRTPTAVRVEGICAYCTSGEWVILPPPPAPRSHKPPPPPFVPPDVGNGQSRARMAVPKGFPGDPFGEGNRQWMVAKVTPWSRLHRLHSASGCGPRSMPPPSPSCLPSGSPSPPYILSGANISEAVGTYQSGPGRPRTAPDVTGEAWTLERNWAGIVLGRRLLW